MCPQIYSPIPISIDRANLSNISKNNAYPIILFQIKEDMGVVGKRKCITMNQIRLFCVCVCTVHTNIRFLWD